MNRSDRYVYSAEGERLLPRFLQKESGKGIMEKRKMTVTVGGKPYTLVSSDPPEYVRRVADFVDRKLSETISVTQLPSAQAAVLTCFNLAEDLIRAQDENAMLCRRMERIQRQTAAERQAAAESRAAAERIVQEQTAISGKETD